MPTVSLPADADLGWLRRRARELQRAVRAGDRGALARVRRRTGTVPPDPGSFTLSAAQLVVAREYGFTSWPRLKGYFDVVAEHRWDGAAPPAGPAGRFCALACLTYGDDDPVRRAEAGRMHAARPELTWDDVCAAAVAADVEAVREHIARDPAVVHRRGGAGWRPLFHLAYARPDPEPPGEAVLATARLLLDAGADPNEGYLWHGLPTPFTVLTGVFGEGEQGPEATPAHPHWPALARLLLAAGADPNDGQALYNRMFGRGDDHLRLLFAYGLGSGDGGPWRARLGEAVDSPAEMLRGQLRWAVEHGLADRVRLLAGNGVDVHAPFADGRTPVALAERNGDAAMVECLRALGATTPAPDPVDAFVGAAMRGDRDAVDRLPDRDTVIAAARRARPGLIAWAAARGRTEAIVLLAGLGFDVSARGRTDVPIEQPWETALHHAAATGDAELARLLLTLGADPDVRDARFNATPLGWARHFGHDEVATILEPITDSGTA